VSDYDQVRLSVYSCFELEFHLRLLEAEYFILPEKVPSKHSYQFLVDRFQGFEFQLPISGNASPVHIVYVTEA